MPTIPAPRRAELLLPLQRAAEEFGINNHLREAAFLANLAVETGEFRLMVENLNYSAQGLLKVFKKYFTPAQAQSYARQPERIANRVYANRMGNGPESSGDGWKYRGRGVIQITGRDNYRRHGNAIGVDIEHDPDRAADPDVAFRIAGAFFKSNGCNQLADQQNFAGVCKAINGAFPPHGWIERQRYYNRSLQVLSVGDQPAPIDDAAGTMRSLPGVNLRGSSVFSGREREVPQGLSRGIYPGRDLVMAETVEEVRPVAAKKAVKKSAKKATKKAAKKISGKKTASKKSASKKSVSKASGKKSSGRKGAAKKATSKKSATKKVSAKKAGGKKGGGKKRR